MSKTVNSLCAAASLAAAMLPVAASATQFIQNGNFEQSTLSGPAEIQALVPWDIFQQNSITDWTINWDLGTNVFYYQNATATTGANGVTAISPSFANVANVAGDTLQPGAVQNDPETGGHFVALDGNNYSQGDSSIYQTVTGLTPGKDYTLSFYWGGAQLAIRTGPTTETMKVTFGDQTQSTPTVAEGTHYFSGWMESTMNFVAQSSSQVLTFQAIGTPSGSPPMLVLDGVSLTDDGTVDAPPPTVAAVPEASTWALLLMGCAAIGGYGTSRRRSEKSHAES
jgi:hypothetical protein